MKKFSLDDIEKTEPFPAPDRYFEDLPMRVQKRIESTRSPAFQSWSPRWSLAGVAVLFALSIGVFFWKSTPQQNPGTLDAIATADLIYFLEVEFQTENISREEWGRVFENVSMEDSLWNEHESEINPASELTDEELLMLYNELSNTDEIL